MNTELLQWGLFSFMIGMILSLPLAAVFYQKDSQWKRMFPNPRKLLSAHLDFFMQAFALGFVFLLEFTFKQEVPKYVIVPLIFGSICNPLILFIEATPYNRCRFISIIRTLLRAIGPISLLFAWAAIAILFLPGYLKWSLLVITLILAAVMLLQLKANKSTPRGERKWSY